jgi:RHS repeat-associated protein
MIRGGTTYRILSDHLGSPRLVVDTSTGAIAQRLDYDDWGRVLQDTAPGLQPFGFAGGLYDSGTGLVRFGARDYDQQVGRWTARDPIGFRGRGENLFAYALLDPINRFDWTGTRTTIIIVRDFGVGTHAAAHLDKGPGGDQLLYDPAGGFVPPGSGRRSGDIFSGNEADLDSYIAYHEATGSTVETFVFDTTPEQESLIGAKAIRIGGVSAPFCSLAVSSAITGIGPFEQLPGPGLLSLFPGILAQRVRTLVHAPR